MTRDHIAAALSIVLLAAFVIEAPALLHRPTRSECIIGYSVDWSVVKADHNEVRNAFTTTPGGHRLFHALSAMGISDAGDRLYLQFNRDCGNKQNYAEKLINRWKSDGLDIPKFTRIPDPIVPSPKTIDVAGRYWRD